MTKKISVEKYLALLGIRVDAKTLRSVKNSWDLDCILDATYLFKTDQINYELYCKAQSIVHDYMNGKLSSEYDWVDLSESLSAEYSHYTLDDLLDSNMSDDEVVEVELDDESRFYEEVL